VRHLNHNGLDNQRNNLLIFYPPPIRRLSPEERRAINLAHLALAQKHLTHENLSNWAKKRNAMETPEQQAERIRRSKEATSIGQQRAWGRVGGKRTAARLAKLPPQQIHAQMSRVSKAMPYERKRAMMLRARAMAELKPNKIELAIAHMLGQHNLYADYSRTALPGQVYYADAIENRIYIRLANGAHKVPDFKVKSQKKVLEVYGDYFHSRPFSERNGAPDYSWNADRMVEEYAKVGYRCLVLWEHEIKEQSRRQELVERLLAFISERAYGRTPAPSGSRAA